MTLPFKHPLLRVLGLPAISALATIMVAAAADTDRNWARLRALPAAERIKLLDAIKKFDLLYTREQQQALRDLDRRINELEPSKQTEYVDVLRRYHDWLVRLPEKEQDTLRDTAPEERFSLVRKLVVQHPVPTMMTARFLQTADLGDYSPFELAAMFKIWELLKPERRAAIDRVTALPKRHEALLRLGEQYDIPREIKPPDFDERHWTSKFESFATAKRPNLLLSELKKKQELVHAAIRRRQAINYYFIQNRPRSVTPGRLTDFLAAFPPWLRSTFDSYPPDEAQRRLTIVYRLVFPFPAEMKSSAPPATSPPGARSAPGPPRGAPEPPAKGHAKPGQSPF
jgi:hypothetical protein